MKNSFFSGNVYATNCYFNGDITANTLTLGSSAKVSGTVYGTSGKFENASIKNITASTFSATNAYLSGKVVANEGSFKGDITANSLTLGNSAYVSGTVYATSGKFNNVTATNFSADNSYFKGVIKATTLYLGDDEVTSIPDTTGMLKQGVYYSAGTGTSKNVFFVDTNGLLKAQNAIISGTVYATNGVFNGKVYAVDGDFDGNITADTLTLRNTASVSGAVYATSGKFYNGSFDKITATNFSASNAYISGKISATALELNTSASNSIKNAIDLDDYYLVGETVSNGSSSVTISTGGLLTAKNAIISGSVYATNGYFKGKVEATDGSFKGAISATSLYLGGQTYTEMPDNGGVDEDDLIDMGFYRLGDSVSANAYSASFKVSTAGLLTCKNAIVSGSVYATDGFFKGSISATDGYFTGTIDAADIYLGGKSLKWGASNNGLIISNNAITVDYVPKTYAVTQAPSIVMPFYSGSWQTGGTGSTYVLQFTSIVAGDINIPSIKISNDIGGYGDGGSYGSNETIYLTATTYVTTAYNSTSMLQYATGTTSVGLYFAPGSYSSTSSIGSVTTPQFSISASANKTYYLYVKMQMAGGGTYLTSGTATHTVKKGDGSNVSVLVPGGSPENTQQVKIGSNGIQILLGNSFYLTAANRGTSSSPNPIIAMGGNVGGNMKTIKIDSDGLVIDQ